MERRMRSATDRLNLLKRFQRRSISIPPFCQPIPLPLSRPSYCFINTLVAASYRIITTLNLIVRLAATRNGHRTCASLKFVERDCRSVHRESPMTRLRMFREN